jgi:hypothetical protein
VGSEYGRYGIIRETDMYSKRPEFQLWAMEVGGPRRPLSRRLCSALPRLLALCRCPVRRVSMSSPPRSLSLCRRAGQEHRH